MKKETLAYIAGVMDSDGYFTIRRSTYNIRKIGDSQNPHYCERTGIKQVQSQAIKLIHKLFGGYLNIQKSNTKNGKPLWGVQLTNLKAHNFVKALYPFLRLKRKQAKILLNLRKSLNKGKTKPQYTFSKNRWGQINKVKRYAIANTEIKKREKMISQLKILNDSRNDKFHTPLPWK